MGKSGQMIQCSEGVRASSPWHTFYLPVIPLTLEFGGWEYFLLHWGLRVTGTDEGQIWALLSLLKSIQCPTPGSSLPNRDVTSSWSFGLFLEGTLEPWKNKCSCSSSPCWPPWWVSPWDFPSTFPRLPVQPLSPLSAKLWGTDDTPWGVIL